MPNTTLTEAKIKSRIESRLGGSGVAIELEPGDYVEVIHDVLEEYNQVRPGWSWAAIAVSVTQKKYILTNANFPGIQGVLHVHFITRRTQPTQVDPFDPFDTALAGITLGSGSGETFGEIAQRLTYTEDAARIVDSEPEWEVEIDQDGQVVLYIDKVRTHVEVALQYVYHFTPDNAAKTGMQLIPNGDVGWIMDYATALARVRLGEIRNKFGGIQNPDGGQDPVDGDSQIQRGEAAMEALKDELRRRRRPLAPVIE